MSRLVCIHDLEVIPGINEADFKDFFINEMIPTWALFDWKLTLLKGDRGQRTGKYALLIEIKSIEDRDRWTPEEEQRWVADHKALMEALTKKWAEFSTTDIIGGKNPEYTDYIVLE
jgi:hypothetical protein